MAPEALQSRLAIHRKGQLAAFGCPPAVAAMVLVDLLCTVGAILQPCCKVAALRVALLISRLVQRSLLDLVEAACHLQVATGLLSRVGVVAMSALFLAQVTGLLVAILQ
jgi:hypothetical protein